jgi:hypothetical protein
MSKVDRDTRLRVFGTDEALAKSHRLTAGALTVEIAGGAVRGLFWHGVEVLRGIDYPVRDADWGTYAATTTGEHLDEADGRFAYSREFSVGDDLFAGTFTCSGSSAGAVTAELQLTANRNAEVNRAGFVFLHPVAGVAGSPLRVTHSDGSIEDTTFPEHISPSQPVFDIAAMRQSANRVAADIAFTGDTFEMEDQRNWSDASYKTYCRPLSLPYPYDVAAGSVIKQSIAINLSGSGAAASADTTNAITLGPASGRKLPEVSLALEPGWESDSAALRALEPAATLLRLDLTDPDWSASLPQLLASAHGALDLELIVSDAVAEIAPSLAFLRTLLDQSRIAPRSITTLPAAYLKSYQPDAKWPAGATPEQATAAARKRFPTAEVGGGVRTNFTELNRYRGAASAGDFITHGTTAIVHAADDVSVLQTLQALPQIFASAEALAPTRPYRLGLVSIGMRSNPYGATVAENPSNIRRPMAMADPRQRGLFAAAWMIAAVAATEASKVESLALAAPSGPLGLLDGDNARPVFHVFAALTRLNGRDRLSVETPAGIAAIAASSPHGTAVMLANLTPEVRTLDLPQPAQFVILHTLQPDLRWLTHASRQTGSALALGPFAVAFASIGPHDFFGPSP